MSFHTAQSKCDLNDDSSKVCKLEEMIAVVEYYAGGSFDEINERHEADIQAQERAAEKKEKKG